MSIRKRTWTTPKTGEERTAWVVTYTDSKGKRRQKTFPVGQKKKAQDFAASTNVEIRQGIHVADSASIKVSEAGEIWIKGAIDAGLERTSTDAYRSHLRLHINPFIGQEKLTDLTVSVIRAFEDNLRENGRSPAMVRKALVSLGTMLADAQERGFVARNVIRDLRGRRKRGEQQGRRQRGKLKVGMDIPSPEEVKLLLKALQGRWKPLLLVATFCGLRASEVRGLRWADIDFTKREVHVRQRADKYNDIGRPKSQTSERTVPLPPMVASALKEWKLACPRRSTGKTDKEGNPVKELHYVFPNGLGNIESHTNIRRRGLIPAMVRAGLSAPVLDDQGAPKLTKRGKPLLTGKYSGLHALRHFFASWCINRKEDGGLGLPAKVVQERMGHSTITLTLDRYGHLFPRGDDTEELAEAERTFYG